MSRQPGHPPPPPVVQRLQVRYAKRGRLRFTSHRDFARAFERALRRGAVPVAYSAGFTPHPKISYVGAAPTGVSSEAEYLEIGLAEQRDPEQVRRDLDAALPAGLDIVGVVEATGGSLPERINASRWRVELPRVGAGDARASLARFLTLETAAVERVVKDGRRTVDARAAVVDIRLAAVEETPGNGPCAIIEMVVRHTTPAVRPDDVVTALRQAAALSTPVTPRVTRLAQGLLDETRPVRGGAADPPPHLADPLAPGVAAASPR